MKWVANIRFLCLPQVTIHTFAYTPLGICDLSAVFRGTYVISILEEDSKEALWPINMIVKNSNICRFFWLRTLSKIIILAVLWETWSCQQSKNILNTFKYQVTPFKKLFQETVNIHLHFFRKWLFAQLPPFQLHRPVISILYLLQYFAPI